MSIQRLPVFLSAAEHLNFTKAAEEHCISQTAVSQQIKLLEQDIGFPLFIREKRGVQLTPAGRAFYMQCKKLMTQYHNAVSEGKKIAAGQESDLRVGYAGAYELWTISSTMRQYTAQRPEADVQFVLGTNQTLISQLANGQLDMAVLSGFGLELGNWLDSKVTLKDPCLLMISKEDPLAKQAEIDPADLKGYPIMFNKIQDTVSSEAQIASMYSHMGLSENKRVYIDDIYSLSLLVSMGMGVIVAPSSLLHWGIEGVAFRPIKGFQNSAKTLLVYPKQTTSPGVQEFLRLL